MSKKKPYKHKRNAGLLKDSIKNKKDLIKKENFQWSFENFDFNFPVDVKTHLTLELLLTKIIPTLQQHEQEKWGTMYTHQQHHFIADMTTSKNPAPMKRLKHLKIENLDDEFFSFRIDSKKRLYGHVVGAVFYILWYDHSHLLYPSAKRNT